MAIGLGTTAAKRSVKYGFDMLGIGADALLQQLTPFGMPRWLTQDYSGFMPQWDAQGALGDLMSGGAQTAAQQTDPNTVQHGQAAPGALPGPDGQPIPGASMAGGSPFDPAAQMPQMFDNTANSFLQTQLAQPEAPAPNTPPMFKVDNIYTTDAESVGRELTKRGKLAQMQYTGRP